MNPFGGFLDLGTPFSRRYKEIGLAAGGEIGATRTYSKGVPHFVDFLYFASTNS